MSARSELAALLTPLLPKSWRLVPSYRTIDRINSPTVRIGINKIAPVTEAGYGTAYNVTGTISLASHLNDIEKAEDALEDDLLPKLLDALESIDRVQWSDAEKTRWQDQQLAYDVTITFTITKE